MTEARLKAQQKQLERLRAEWIGELPACKECEIATLLADELRSCIPCGIEACKKAGVMIGVWG